VRARFGATVETITIDFKSCLHRMKGQKGNTRRADLSLMTAVGQLRLLRRISTTSGLPTIADTCVYLKLTAHPLCREDLRALSSGILSGLVWRP
jgi:hypothetical protein